MNAWSDRRREFDAALDAWLAARTEFSALEAKQRTLQAGLQTQQQLAQSLEQRVKLLNLAAEQSQVAQQQLMLAEGAVPTAVFQQQIAALKPEFDKAAAECQKLATELEPLPQQLAEAQAKIGEAEAAKLAAEPLQAESLATWQAERDKHQHLKHRLVELNKAHELLVAELSVVTAQRQVSPQAARLTELNTQLAAFAQQQEQLGQTLLEKQNSLVELSERVAGLRQLTTSQANQLDRLQKLQQSFVAMSNSLEEANQWLAADQLADIQQTTQTRLNQCVGDLGSLQQQHKSTLAELEQQAVAQDQLRAVVAGLQLETQTLSMALEATSRQQAEVSGAVAAARETLAAANSDWLELAENGLILANLKPLTPEQLAWSLMQVTGVIDNQVAAQLAELEKATPLTDEQRGQPAVMAARQQHALSAALEKLRGSVNVFVSLFGHGAGQPQDGFFATVDQSLFFANAGTVQGWIGQGGNSLYQRLLKLEDVDSFAEELYLSVLCRPPSPEEVEVVGTYLEGLGTDRAAATRELAWALVTSAEFRFNH